MDMTLKDDKDESPKVNISARVSKILAEAVDRIAIEKDWSSSKTIERLLGWTISQLEVAGSFDALMKSTVVRDPRITQNKSLDALRAAQKIAAKKIQAKKHAGEQSDLPDKKKDAK